MADAHVLRLGEHREAFFDPQTGFMLTLGRPQGAIPADRPLSKAILTALRSGGLIDVGNTTNFRAEPTAPVPEAPVVEQATPALVEEPVAVFEVPDNFPKELLAESEEAPKAKEPKPKTPRKPKQQ